MVITQFRHFDHSSLGLLFKWYRLSIRSVYLLYCMARIKIVQCYQIHWCHLESPIEHIEMIIEYMNSQSFKGFTKRKTAIYLEPNFNFGSWTNFRLRWAVTWNGFSIDPSIHPSTHAPIHPSRTIQDPNWCFFCHIEPISN